MPQAKRRSAALELENVAVLDPTRDGNTPIRFAKHVVGNLVEFGGALGDEVLDRLGLGVGLLMVLHGVCARSSCALNLITPAFALSTEPANVV